jgi:hypothetical protein
MKHILYGTALNEWNFIAFFEQNIKETQVLSKRKDYNLTKVVTIGVISSF